MYWNLIRKSSVFGPFWPTLGQLGPNLWTQPCLTNEDNFFFEVYQEYSTYHFCEYYRLPECTNFFYYIWHFLNLVPFLVIFICLAFLSAGSNFCRVVVKVSSFVVRGENEPNKKNCAGSWVYTNHTIWLDCLEIPLQSNQ